MKLMKGIFYKVNKKKNNVYLIYSSLMILFFTLIFQIITIIRLNTIEKQLDVKLSKEYNINVNVSQPGDSPDQTVNVTDNETTSSDTTVSTDFSEQITDFNKEDFLNNALFIGDSRTESLQRFTDAGLHSSFCCQVGANVNNITDVMFVTHNESLNLYTAVGKYKYKNVLICLGFNELGWKNEDTFINNYAELIGNIKTLSPDTNIFVIAITHIGINAITDNEFENNDRINLYNSLIEKMCNERNVKYIDVNSDLINTEGFLPDEYTTDGIHFKNQYNNTYLDKLFEKIKDAIS